MTERGDVGKGLKRKMIELGGSATFIDVESGGSTVHELCPKQREGR
jgi:hypothetical protein